MASRTVRRAMTKMAPRFTGAPPGRLRRRRVRPGRHGAAAPGSAGSAPGSAAPGSAGAAPSPRSARNRSSSDRRAGTTAWTAAPPATRAATSAGTFWSASGSTTSHSPSGRVGPKRVATAAASGRPVTRTRTPPSASMSAIASSATIRPRSTIATRSQTRSTSVSRCELRNTVTPRDRSSPMISRTSWRPTGSRADVGSSRTTSSGRPSSATASPRRCCMPLENVSTRLLDRSVSPTSSSAPASSRSHDERSSRASSQWRASTSRAVIQPW